MQNHNPNDNDAPVVEDISDDDFHVDIDFNDVQPDVKFKYDRTPAQQKSGKARTHDYNEIPIAPESILNPKKTTDISQFAPYDIKANNKSSSIPAIVNGYKLVLASPYKKVWKTTHKTKKERLNEPFNEWLANQFNKSINNVDWKEGKYVLTENENMQKLMDVYGKKGLPKPRVSKRLTPNGYWASAFSHIWKLFWNINDYSTPTIQALKKATNYLTVANTIFIYLFDQPAKYAAENSHEFGKKFLTYARWAAWRRVNKNKYNASLGPEVVKFVNTVIGSAVNLETGELTEEDGSKWHPKLQQLIKLIEVIIFDWGFGIPFQNGQKSNRGQLSPYEEIANDIYAGQLQEIKKDWAQMIAVNIHNIIYKPQSEYLQYKAATEEDKNRRRDEAAILVKAKDAY
ncbi:hypothetical protein M9Y10_032173 [Tritrichomonas musculus]|uniref:Uncharacterized protein n=1 Tax=Tritrichomonas musculus TaxID=1915356 RepID=A0ABR2GZ71_9EUKA